MAAKAHTTRSRAPKVTAAQASVFMAKLLDPLPDAELADPDWAKLERRAIKRRWETGWYGVRAAATQREAILYRGCYARDHLARPLDVAEWRRQEEVALREYVGQVDRQFLLLAPDAAAVKWKRSVLKVGLKCLSQAPYETRDTRFAGRLAAIAADEARLGIAPEASA